MFYALILLIPDAGSDALPQLNILEVTVNQNAVDITELQKKNKEQDERIKKLENKIVDVPGQGMSCYSFHIRI